MEKQKENGKLDRLRKKIMQGVLGCLFAVGVMLLLPGTEIKAQKPPYKTIIQNGITYFYNDGNGTTVLHYDPATAGTEVHIPAEISDENEVYNVTKIGSDAFQGKGLEKITLEEGLERIAAWAFAGTKLTEIEIPESVIDIYGFAFSGSQLTKIRFRGTTPPQLYNTFDGTSGPITIEIPEAQMKQYGKLNCCRMPVLLVNIQSR